ncbi:MAG: acylphosphatase [Candidatus Neomarinimicrobiota bacterium]
MDWELPKTDNTGATIKITGRVQKVGFRWFAVQWAQDMELGGFVRNLHDGSVFVEVEGKRNRIESFIKELKQGPKGSQVDKVTVTWKDFEHKFRDFEIRY